MTKRTVNIIFIIILSILSVYALFPFLWVIVSSLKNNIQIFTGVVFPYPICWKNYPEAWAQGDMARVTVNSLIVTSLSALIGLAIDILAGYSFAKLAIRKHAWLFYLYLIALAIPLEANVFSIYVQIRQLGLANKYSGIVLALVGTGTAFGTFMLRNFFRDIPDTFGESARIDGASKLAIFARIYLPLAMPATSALIIFKIIQAWNEYYMSLFILTNQAKWTIPLAVATFKNFQYSNYGYIFACAVMSFLPTVLLYILFNKKFIAGITVGGIKG